MHQLNKNVRITAVALVLAGILIGVSLIVLRLPARTAQKPTLASPHYSATLEPLSIAQARAHALTPSTITVTQTLAPRGGCATQIVSFTSDGLTEYSLLSTPASTMPAGGYPVVILAHGYIDPTTYQTAGTDYQDFINTYCAAGYMVLKPDYRGDGKSQGTPTSGHFFPDYTYDLLNLTASLPTLPQANARDVVMIGHSLGGAVVLRAAVVSHNLPIKGYIFASGVVGSWSDILNDWPESEVPADLAPVRQQIVATYGTPTQNPTFWHDGSAINYVSSIKVPVQIFVGSADTVVPPLMSQHLDAALSATHVAHQFFDYPGGDHQYTLPGQRQQFLTQSLVFLSHTLR